MKKLVLLLSLTFSFSYATNCLKLKNENICATIQWVDGPYIGEYSSNVVKFLDIEKSNSDLEVYVDPAHPVEFYGWMKMGRHEHGTSPVITSKVSPGIYLNEKVFFMSGMKGKWQFNFKTADKSYTLFEIKTR